MRGEEAGTSLLDHRIAGIDLRSLGWLLMMSTTLFVLLFPFSSYVAALPIIQDEWGLNNTQAGAIFSAYLAGFAVSALVVVPLTDRLGSTRIFVFSTTVSTVANVLFPLIANDAITASILRAIAGLGLVGVYNPGDANCRRTVRGQRARLRGGHIRYILLRVQQRVAYSDRFAYELVRVA